MVTLLHFLILDSMLELLVPMISSQLERYSRTPTVLSYLHHHYSLNILAITLYNELSNNILYIKKSHQIGEIFLSALYIFLESDELCIGPTQIIESRSNIDSEIAVVPWLYLVFIHIYSLLIALCPSIEMCIFSCPLDIFFIGWIVLEFFFTTRIEYINRESELMFAISRRSTQ